MLNGQCPKCSSSEVYCADKRGTQQGITDPSLISIVTDKKWIPDVAMVAMAYYLCRNCGYFEQYALDLAKLTALDGCSNWRKVANP
jgi:predicted nucleic-acid-binding Zn-ribbon protein